MAARCAATSSRPALVGVVLGQRLGIQVRPEDLGWQPSVGDVLFVPATHGLDLPWNASGALQAITEVSEADVMDRRILLQLTGAALTQPALAWLIAQPSGDATSSVGRRVQGVHLDDIESMTDRLRRMDDQFGGGAVLDLVNGHVCFVLDLLRDHRYTAQVGLRLHGAAAELLRLAGWLSFDAGRGGRAQRYWVAALRAAHSAGDRALGSNILGFMSSQAKDGERYNEAIQLADAARQGYQGASARVRAILELRVAEAHAQLADVTGCRAAVERGYGALRDATAGDGGPPWSYWLDEAQVNAQAGYCYIRLGDWPRAQHHLSAAIRSQGDAYSREGALRQALLAVAHARQGDPEQACAIAGAAVDVLAEDVDSTRCVGHVRRVQDALAPYQRIPAVTALRERVDQVFGVAT
jgi:tetratricopeptide (TPR) repeat protein